VMIGTDCIDSCKFSYHTITATMTPSFLGILILVVYIYNCNIAYMQIDKNMCYVFSSV
jgi:hypothetical protein